MKIPRIALLVILPLGFVFACSARAQTASGNVANFSALLQIPPGGSAPPIGFVVAGSGLSGGTFLIRAVGPSLKLFGILNPASQPQINVMNADGQPFVSLVTFFGLFNWTSVFASVGAFPLLPVNPIPGPGIPADAYQVAVFAPGAYSVQVTDASGKGGAVLLEFYANPAIVLTGQ
jgi:hypothetical protein